MPLGPPATPPPAGPPPLGSGSAQSAATAGTGPGVNPASTAKTDPAAGVAPMPVSAARMERDTVASASTAGAMQRQRRNSSAALIHARRIAAALNMGTPQYGFFWVTGLTADGSIVVANSYGIGYIPDGVELPPQVTMASADESIAPTERAKWATYPILAIQGWAQAHDQKLRAVIATAEQFASFDPGIAKVVLQRDDIPQTGKMEGRNRLEVIAPETAARLASVADGALQDLLPVAPADSTPPDDRSAMLWFELTKPLMSTASNRGLTHLEAFVQYADHAQELALHKAHNALDAEVQRAAIADWVYWQHLSVLMSDAISADATV
ncbi:secretion protein EccK [Mycobacterium antarcticum]|uniref:secretion protein EccK n=2 Tax=unclassified Mycolicibacterium TaxID=2636767 RepID=UPI00257270FC|nr:secretion protein EccK [Mycolicibacterium sp. TUM20985]